jgi:hypothetical protein
MASRAAEMLTRAAPIGPRPNARADSSIRSSMVCNLPATVRTITARLTEMWATTISVHEPGSPRPKPAEPTSDRNPDETTIVGSTKGMATPSHTRRRPG